MALALLARREHSEKELSRKLRTKNFSANEIQIVITQLTQENLLSNNRFIENYIHHRRAKGYGPLHIRAELLERGITENLIEAYLNSKDNEWFMSAQKVWQKRFKSQLPEDFKKRAQQMRFLQSRGFTFEQIENIFLQAGINS